METVLVICAILVTISIVSVSIILILTLLQIRRVWLQAGEIIKKTIEITNRLSSPWIKLLSFISGLIAARYQ